MDDLFDILMGLVALFGGAFVVLVMPILSIVNWRRVSQLKGEVQALRQQIANLRAGPTGAAATAPQESATGQEAPMPQHGSEISGPLPAEAAPEPILHDPVLPDPVQPEPVVSEPALPGPAAAEPADETRPKAPRKDLEGRLGGRVYGWLGGIALALAGIFLVKHSIEQGWLSPGVRVGLGILFGFVLLGVAQWMRRQSSNLGQALSAASVAVLYAALFAGVALYDLVPPILAFAVLAALTFAAIALALRDGPFVGIVGLAGGFLTPFIVSTGSGNWPVLFVFLFLLQLGALTLLKLRGWWYQAAIANAGGLLWGMLAIVDYGWGGNAFGTWSLPLFLIATSAAAIWAMQSLGGVARSRPMIWTTRATSIAAMVVMAAWLHAADYTPVDWFLALALALGHLVAARRWTGEDVPAYVANAILIAAYAAWWPYGWAPPSEIIPDSPLIDRTGELIGIGLVYGAALTFGGWYFIFGAARPTRWAAVSALGSAFVFGAAYLQLRETEMAISWPVIAVILAALHFGLAQRLDSLRRRDRAYVDAFAVHCLAVTGFIAIAIPMQLEEAWVAVAWSLQLPVVAWIANRLEIAWLRQSIWIGAGLILFGIVWSGLPAGDTLVFNWLLYGLGIPLAGFVVTAMLLTATPQQNLRRALQAGAAALGFILLALEVEHFCHHIMAPDPAFLTHGVQAVAWLVAAHLLLAIADRRQAPVLHRAAMVIAAIAALWLLINPLFIEMPLFERLHVGETPIFNRIGLIYGLSALLLMGFARGLQKRPQLGKPAEIGYKAAGGFGLFLGFVCISLWVRQMVHGADISLLLRDVTDAELYGYSAAWTLYGVALLGLGIRLQSQALRYASAAVVLLTVLKVGLVDASDLTGLYRVASFLGLGIALIGIGWLYQRILFRKDGTVLTPR